MEAAEKRLFNTAFMALIKLLYEKDFANIKVDEICEIASISRATFYRYFESKEHLLYSRMSFYITVSFSRIKDKRTLKEYLLGAYDVFMRQTKESTTFINLNKNRNSLFKIKCTLFDVFESILYKAIKDDYGRDEKSAIKLSKVVTGLIFAYRSFLYEFNY